MDNSCHPTSEIDFFLFFTSGGIEHAAEVVAELLSDAAVIVVGPFAPGVAEARGAVVGQAVAGAPDAVEPVGAVAGNVARPGHPVTPKSFLDVVGVRRGA